ncbi:uncharacterized protein SCHCODRAFT_02681625 [Schizophyllum commune H4-8]|uniref:MYND-type domain-containing protein n=1 Tax=Schizophyllum commune (strain H4-8 / FGSC 9210) TaxID=578458 RepID=D8QIZ2_SCHCM|nr:uncharacterized protein SCHCODRAFT_02681625 [Schizophyllum commune H4-8]KAI5886224.1 hypothetical protein SCHCODRAFT_02681625 [Schizophyllum commune H4-8]
MDSDLTPSSASQSAGLKIRLPARKDWPSNQPRKIAGGSRVQRAMQVRSQPAAEQLIPRNRTVVPVHFECGSRRAANASSASASIPLIASYFPCPFVGHRNRCVYYLGINVFLSVPVEHVLDVELRRRHQARATRFATQSGQGMFALSIRYQLGLPADHKFQQLQEVLEDLRTRDVKQARTKDLVKEALDILRRLDPFYFLRCEPPTPEDLSYEQFWTASQANAQDRIVAPILALLSLRKLADRPGLRSLWVFDDTAWIRMFEWIEYLLVFPHRHETDLMDPADCRALVLSHVAPSLKEIVDSFYELSNARLEGILLIAEARAQEILVDMWLKWRTIALTLDRPGGEYFRAILRFTNDCVGGVKGEKVRQLFVHELSRINFYLPRRIYCEMTYQVASLLHRSTVEPELEDEIWALHTAMMSSLIELAELSATGYPQRMTRTLAQGLFMVLLQPRNSCILKGLLEILFAICRLSTDASAITCAIRHRVFYILIQLEKLGLVDVQPMFDLVAGALVTPAALRAFHNAFRLVSRSDRQSLRDRVAHIVVTYTERYKLIEAWEKEWPELQTCRRRECPNPESTDLRACPCGEVLFCSEECQRANWTDGQHGTVCWRGKETAGSLSAKKLSFLVAIARFYLEENQAEIKQRLGAAYNPHHTVSLSLDITLAQERWMSPFSVPGPYPDAPQTFFMAVHFMQGARRCARALQFFPDWWAGKSRGMPYVQLSHSFFKTGLPVEENLTPRERLFGRRAEPRTEDAESE